MDDSGMPIPVSGQQLVTDFRTVFQSLVMSESAQYAAETSEAELLQRLDGAGRNSYLNPGTLDTSDRSDLSIESLDAHIKKVQAHQIDELKDAQIAQIQAEDTASYAGKKVVVTLLGSEDAVESVWRDNTYEGGFRIGIVRRKQITGYIQEIALDKNALILRPTSGRRLFSGGLENYVVYVVNPDTFEPMVTIDLV